MTDKTAPNEKAGQAVAVCAGADCRAAPLFPKGSYTVEEIAHSGMPHRLTQRGLQAYAAYTQQCCAL